MRHFDAHGDHSESTQSAESVLDTERDLSGRPNLNSSNPSFPPLPSGGQHSESNAACFSWPNSTQLHGAVAGRENYFGNLQKGVFLGNPKRSPTGQQATTLLDLMIIRALHSKILHRCSLGTAIGFRIRMGTLTDIPAILVFVARKVHRKWLRDNQCLPTVLEVGSNLYMSAPAEIYHAAVVFIHLSCLVNRGQEVYGVMWMLWNFLIMVRQLKHLKSNYTLSSWMVYVEVIRALVHVLR